MIGRRFTVRQKLAALAPVLLLVVALPGQELLRCQIDGLLRTACCCPGDKAGKSGNPTAVVKAQGCCDRTATATDRPPAETTRTALDEFGRDSFQALAAPVAFAPVELDRGARVWPSQGPPRDGPSVVLLKQSFLI